MQNVVQTILVSRDPLKSIPVHVALSIAPLSVHQELLLSLSASLLTLST
jgi:hypothetical protein